MTPSKPISPSFGINSDGKREASSHSITWGAISDSANSRTLRRRCCFSSVKEKSTGPQESFSAFGQTNYLYHRAKGSLWRPSWMVPKLHFCTMAEKDLTQSSRSAESTEATESFETAQCATSYLRDSELVPAHLVSGVLFVQPLFERREVIEDRGGIHLALAGHYLEGVGPGAALSHGQHFRELRPGCFVGINRAAI